YWFAEHHSLPSVASSSPEVLIAHVAARTERIRVGSGGIMLPNHVPLRIAEAFHTLAALHPGRIDLGIGRAPGSEPIASQALRAFDGNAFSSLMSELIQLSRGLYEPGHPFHPLKVMPPDVERPPIFLLGSSGASATSAGRAGMGYAFASHFSATDPGPAIAAYRENFQVSEGFEKPHAILGAAAVVAETDEEARRLASTMELAWLRIEHGEFLPLPSPEEADAYAFTAGERASIERRRRLTVTGSAKTVREELERRAEDAGADEVMVVTNIWSHEARLRSYELLAES
ncbi:MAG TPA: LLM class flavin-dependent oxidoreductase, partial [Methylomirabilota bacterium]|nr:LLM class flavin-dependent oxidoreductase [Methylomirabilota bacterium]